MHYKFVVGSMRWWGVDVRAWSDSSEEMHEGSGGINECVEVG